MAADRVHGETPPIIRLHVLAIFVAAVLIASTVLNHRNTLHTNGHWEVGKIALARGVMGAASAMVTRVPLHRNRLSLGAYFGYQEYTLDEDREIRELEFRFRVADGGYLDVLLGDGDEIRAGIRLAGDPRFESLLYRVSPQGEFVSQRLLSESRSLRAGAWNRVRLAADENSVAFSLNDSAARAIELGGLGEQLTFRGGIEDTLVDDVALSFVDESPDFNESFSNRRGGIRLVAAATAALAVASLLAFRTLRRFGGLSSRESHLSVVVAELLVVLAVGLYCAVDFFVFSRLYPLDPGDVDFESYESNIESEAGGLIRLKQLGATLRDDGCRRTMLVGSSQTWGAGARRADEALDRVLERTLRQKDPGGCHTVINAGISGLRSPQLLDHYRDDWIDMEPGLVVINLSNNDQDEAVFRKSLEHFVESNRSRNISTLFVLEPNSPEATTSIEDRHAVMRSVADANGVPLLDMHAHLKSREKDGFLWWDFVHLTSFGQRLFGERLAEKILETPAYAK